MNKKQSIKFCEEFVKARSIFWNDKKLFICGEDYLSIYKMKVKDGELSNFLPSNLILIKSLRGI